MAKKSPSVWENAARRKRIENGVYLFFIVSLERLPNRETIMRVTFCVSWQDVVCVLNLLQVDPRQAMIVSVMLTPQYKDRRE